MYKISLVFVFTLFLSACMAAKPEKPPTGKPVSPVQVSLDMHLNKWKKVNINEYVYEFRRGCFCPMEYTKPVLIRVKNNSVVDARFKDNKQPLPENLKENRQTIQSLFNIIQSAIDRKAYSIKVKYDEQYGYPTSISVDYDRLLADEELYLGAKNLQKL